MALLLERKRKILETYEIGQVQGEAHSNFHNQAAETKPPAKLRRAFDEASIGMSMTSLDNRYLRVNPALCRLFGYDEEELVGARWPVEDLSVPEWVYRPVGCRNCANTGYRGRIALHEVMPVSPEIESLTIRRASSNEIREVAVDQGMYDLRADGLAKAAGGLTSIREVSRVAI